MGPLDHPGGRLRPDHRLLGDLLQRETVSPSELLLSGYPEKGSERLRVLQRLESFAVRNVV